jgi:hypothetical protein
METGRSRGEGIFFPFLNFSFLLHFFLDSTIPQYHKWINDFTRASEASRRTEGAART